MLAHVQGLAVAFRDAARKVDGPTTSTPPQAASKDLSPGWRDEIPWPSTSWLRPGGSRAPWTA